MMTDRNAMATWRWMCSYDRLRTAPQGTKGFGPAVSPGDV